MFKNGANWYSSFNDVQITRQQSVATTMSKSSGFGGHASLFLEYFPVQSNYPAMRNFDLWTPPNSNRIEIHSKHCHFLLNGEIELTTLPKMKHDNTPEKGIGIKGSHH